MVKIIYHRNGKDFMVIIPPINIAKQTEPTKKNKSETEKVSRCCSVSSIANVVSSIFNASCTLTQATLMNKYVHVAAGSALCGFGVSQFLAPPSVINMVNGASSLFCGSITLLSGVLR